MSLRLQVSALTPALLRATVTGPDATEFAVDASRCRVGVRSCTLRVTLAPRSVGAKRAALRLDTGPAGGRAVVGLAGTVVAASGRSRSAVGADAGRATVAPLVFGVADDAPLFARDGGVSVYRDLGELGMRLHRVTLAWNPADPDRDFGLLRRTLAAAARAGWKGRLVLSLFPLPRRNAAGKMIHPNTSAFCSWAGEVAQSFVGRVGTYIVGNEPNLATFWPPGDRAGELYAMLSRCYDAIKAADPAASVAGLGLSPRAPSAASDAPLALLRKIGALYRADRARSRPGSGRRLFDVLAIHPYPNQSVRPTQGPAKGGYENTSFFGIPNLDRVKQAVYEAFDGSAQPTTVHGLRFMVDELGWQVDTSKLAGYSGVENSGTVPGEVWQWAYYDEAIRDWFACDPTVSSVLLFHLIDEPERGAEAGGGGWQSGLEQLDRTHRLAYDGVKDAITANRSGCTTGLVSWKPAKPK